LQTLNRSRSEVSKQYAPQKANEFVPTYSTGLHSHRLIESHWAKATGLAGFVGILIRLSAPAFIECPKKADPKYDSRSARLSADEKLVGELRSVKKTGVDRRVALAPKRKN
jgi:hypothetical protein